MKDITLRGYQRAGVELVKNNKLAALFFQMGLGKTLTVIKAIHDLMWDSLEVRKVLVVAPKKVALIAWPKELKKWCPSMSYQVVYADKANEIRKDVSVYIISYSSIPWLYKEVINNPEGLPRFDMTVLDESTYIKNFGSQRSELCCALFAAIPRKVIMTGKPMPNGLLNLWSQFFFLDKGERLYRNYTDFRDIHFIPINKKGDIGYGEARIAKYAPLRGATEKIMQAISDISLTVTSSDEVDLPELICNRVDCVMDKKNKKLYNSLERESLLQLDKAVINVRSASAMTMKLRQFIQGFVYSDGAAHDIHTEKLDALADLVEESGGSNILCAVQFQYEVEMIRRRFPGAPAIYSKTTDKQAEKILDDWNEGRVPFMMVHPDSVAHGLNIQGGGNVIVWYANTWDLEHYEQLVARLQRSGQKEKTVINHQLCMLETIDEVIIAACNMKAATQDTALDMLIQYRKQKYGV